MIAITGYDSDFHVYLMCDDEGKVKTWHTREDAIKFCVGFGEPKKLTFYFNLTEYSHEWQLEKCLDAPYQLFRLDLRRGEKKNPIQSTYGLMLNKHGLATLRYNGSMVSRAMSSRTF